MFVYLLLGLIVLIGLMWGYIDFFFDEINNSINTLAKKFSTIPTWLIKFIFSMVFIVFWILWPILVCYTLYRATDN